MALTLSCPHCRQALAVADLTHCPHCGAVIPARASPYGLLIALGLVGGVLLLGVLPVLGIGLAWLFSGSTESKPKEEPPVSLVKEQPSEVEIKEPPPPDPRIAIVQPSVDKGVAYLKANKAQVMSLRPAYAGLNGLTLLECGVPADDPVIFKIAEKIRAAGPAMTATYDLASALFFLNRWGESRPLEEKDRKLAQTLALRIIAGQLKTGIWGYNGVVMAPEKEANLLTSLEQGTYRPTQNAVASMSNTQFAMLAVWGARKHGVPVREPLLALAAYFHANQHDDGHWHYPNNSLAATSTCAGLISLAIESALLHDKEFTATPRQTEAPKKKADVNKAFEFVAKTIGRKKNDPGAPRQYGGRLFNADAWGDLYFLWTLERVGVIYSKDVIEGKDWYEWGYPIVMQAQNPDGSWTEMHGPLVDTCFALLFLKRANIARDLTEMIRRHVGN